MGPSAALGQGGGCNNPVALDAIVVVNTFCGLSDGTVLLLMNDDPGLYTFDWNTGATGSQITGVPIGFYEVSISRIAEPACRVDTVVIVNNTDGPPFTLQSVTPANCDAANGAVTLSTALQPNEVSFTWSGGQNGITASNLVSGFHRVTATYSAGGCTRIARYPVPNVNPLLSTIEVLADAKCGLPTGQAAITVNGGTGAYHYSLGGSSQISGLPPGNFNSVITDQNWGCKDTVEFLIDNLPVSGQVAVSAQNAPCPGLTDGIINFNLSPGPNFTLPLTYSLRDANGAAYNIGTVPLGVYTLQISDADGCKLPPDTITISAPPPFNINPFVISASCDVPGQIILNVSGGNGNYTFDWDDLPGADDPQNRINLMPGIYRGGITDGLCSYGIPDLVVPDNCSTPDTIYMVVPLGQSQDLQLTPPLGLGSGNVAYTLAGGGLSGSSTNGQWEITPGGLFRYQAGLTPGVNLDAVGILQSTSTVGLNNNLVVLVTISAGNTSSEEVPFIVPLNGTTTVCGNLPPNFGPITVLYGGALNPSGCCGSYGAYTVNDQNACLTFYANDLTGSNLGPICVMVIDQASNQAHIICYRPSIVTSNGCNSGLFNGDVVEETTLDCDTMVAVCLNLPLKELDHLVVYDNGALYNQSIYGCQPDTVKAYALPNFPGTTPLQLVAWYANGQTYFGFFPTTQALVNYMNQVDPAANWVIDGDFISGGALNGDYGLLLLNAVNSYTLTPFNRQIYAGTVLSLETGDHTLIFQDIVTGCPDTLYAEIDCQDCPTFHNYLSDPDGTLDWTLSQCDADTVFCTNILWNLLPSYNIRLNGLPFNNFVACGDLAGLTLAKGDYQLYFEQTGSGCRDSLFISIVCQTIPVDDTLSALDDEAFTLISTSVTVEILKNDLVRGIVNNPGGLESAVIIDAPNHGIAELDPVTGLLVYTPGDNFCGIDTMAYRLTDTLGRQDEAKIRVVVYCDKVLIYNGISPNGDFLNDTWQMRGIDGYPNNEVWVYNRWGNLVYHRKQYINNEAWDGSWEGKGLPDGTYFYRVDLGDAAGTVLSGYLQILR